jgi:hypothetical protein
MTLKSIFKGLEDRVKETFRAGRNAIFLGTALGATMSMLAYAPTPAMATDETNKVVNIWLNNDKPEIEENNEYYGWSFVVRNNSNIHTNGYNGSCNEVRFFDLYSSSEPTFGSVPTDWNGSYSYLGDNLYNITININDPFEYIPSGGEKNFGIITYLPSTNHVSVIGSLNGDGYIDGVGYFSDSFLGPIGSIEKIVTGNGSITNAPFFYEGSNTTFYVQANPNHRISDIRTNEVSVGTLPENLSQTNYVWQIPTNGTFEAIFTALKTLEVQSAHGEPSPAIGSHEYDEGTSIDAFVEGIITNGTTRYVSKGWDMQGNSPESGTDSYFTFSLTNNAVLTWLWETNYMFTVITNGNGSIEGSPNGWYSLGATNVVTAVPDEHQEFKGWEGDISSLDTTITQHMDKAYSIIAVFEPILYPIVFSKEGEGDIDPSGTTNAPYGTEIPFSAISSNNHRIKKINGEELTERVADTNLTYVVGGSGSLSVNFVPDPYLTVESKGDGNGEVVPNSTYVPWKSSTNVVITAYDKNEISGITTNDVPLDGPFNSPYTLDLSSLLDDIKLEVMFSPTGGPPRGTIFKFR